MKVTQDRVDALTTFHGRIFAETELREVFHPHVAGQDAAQSRARRHQAGRGLGTVLGGAEHRVVHVGVAQVGGHLDPGERDEPEARVGEALELLGQRLQHDLVDPTRG